MNKSSTRYFSTKQEKHVAKKLGGKRTPNSGATSALHSIRGANNSNCKLTKTQVLEIYEKMNSGVNYKEVCKEYGIGQCQAYKIKRKEHWVFNDL